MKLLLVREALKTVEGTRVRSFIAELNRHKGELLLRRGQK
jgi:predicted negative regulator of RcsB-dependent stress response